MSSLSLSLQLRNFEPIAVLLSFICVGTSPDKVARLVKGKSASFSFLPVSNAFLQNLFQELHPFPFSSLSTFLPRFCIFLLLVQRDGRTCSVKHEETGGQKQHWIQTCSPGICKFVIFGLSVWLLLLQPDSRLQ